MNIFMIGGTGFISGATVRLLLERGHRVTTFTRGKSARVPGDSANLTQLTGDRHNRSAVERAAASESFDVVYDMVAYCPGESSLAAEIFRDQIARFIHCSTISVYMVSDDVACPITEDQDKAPLMDFWPRNPFGMEYGVLKRRCEDVLWKAHEDGWFDVSMIRPPYVCGPEDPTIRDFFWIERLLDGGPILVPGDGTAEFQLVYVEDVARAFASLLEHPAATSAKAYNVAGEEILTLNRYLERVAQLLGRTPRLVHIPQAEFDALPFSTYPGADVFPFNTRRDAILALERVKEDLGYQSTPFDEWMSNTIDWYLRQSGLQSNGYERRPAELAFIRSKTSAL